MNYLLSILIPVYNAAGNLNKLFGSVISQWNDEIEVIALDDGSKDNSLEILNKYRDAYPNQIKVITRENKGTVLTRRELFAAASGEWIWAVDSDDEIAGDAIDFLLDKIKNTNADMLMFDNFKVIGTKTREIHRIDANDGEAFSGDKKSILYRQMICTDNINDLWNKVFRRSCIDDADYSKFKDIRMANDKIQLLPILTNANIILYFRKPLYLYRVLSTSLCHDFKDYKVDSVFTVYSEVDRYIDIWQMREKYGSAFAYYIVNRILYFTEKYIREVSDSAADAEKFFNRILAYPVAKKSFYTMDYKNLPMKSQRIFICLKKGKFARAVKIAKIKSRLAYLHGLINMYILKLGK